MSYYGNSDNTHYWGSATKSLVDNVNTVGTDKRSDPAIWKSKELSSAKNKSTKPLVVGKGLNKTKPGNGGGGSIASPLTEQSTTWFNTSTIKTSDGLFTVLVRSKQDTLYKDANNQDVTIKRKDYSV